MDVQIDVDAARRNTSPPGPTHLTASAVRLQRPGGCAPGPEVLRGERAALPPAGSLAAAGLHRPDRARPGDTAVHRLALVQRGRLHAGLHQGSLPSRLAFPRGGRRRLPFHVRQPLGCGPHRGAGRPLGARRSAQAARASGARAADPAAAAACHRGHRRALGLRAGASWELVLGYVNATPFGTTDPLFGQDLSFFVFQLPLWRFLYGGR